MFTARIFLDYFKTYVKTRLTYRSNFWIEVSSDLLFFAMNLTFIIVIFGHTDFLDGWTREEIIFIYGYFMVPYGIFSALFNVWNFSEKYIVKGEMDRVLTRPIHNLTQLLLENMDPPALLTSVIGLTLMAYGWPTVGLELQWWDPFVFVLLVIGSVMIYGGIYVFLTAISFFSDSPTGIMSLMWNIQSYGRYPVTIYNKVLRIVLTWIIPFAFVGFYPAAYFLDESYRLFALLTPVVGAGCMTVALLFWNTGVSRYRGAGS